MRYLSRNLPSFVLLAALSTGLTNSSLAGGSAPTPATLSAAQQVKYAYMLAITVRRPAVSKALTSGKAAPAAPSATAQAKALAVAAASSNCTTRDSPTPANPASGPYVPAKYTSAVPLAQRLALAKKSPPSAKGPPNWAFVSVPSKPAIGQGKARPQRVWPVAAGLGAPKLSPPPSE